MKKSSSLIGGGVFALIGLIMAAVSWNFYKSDKAFMNKSLSAMGTVVRWDYVRSTRGETTFYPVIAFETAEGQKIEFRNGVGTTRRKGSYQEGERVKVRYETQNPANAKIAGFWELWGLTVVLGGFGLVFIGAGLKIMLA
ncbi:DUF3592 domain-containing protein [Runella aurantiaca]|uniref:DUF3592 domain-containing protein n=1 Tax=Runella aurantiaca TaxID=2282308 RepID=A0A369IA76_9BACT|nr:DUF3592 domain-containing protein [Runella aurantiaca]RDB05165.1 DUF3592 domain-containing protein [Runella aurantiaca]